MDLGQRGGQGRVMGKVERSKPSEQMSAAAEGLQSCSNMQTLLHKLLYCLVAPMLGYDSEVIHPVAC